MKITLACADLMRAIDRVNAVVERRATIPILANILLDARDGALAIVATDLDIQSRALITQCAIEGASAITAPCATLRDIAKRLPAGAQVTLQWEGDEATQIKVASGRARFNLPALPASDFPEFSPVGDGARFSLTVEKARDMIARVETAISQEETRYYLNGMYWHVMDGPDGPALRAVTTDGHKMARYEMTAPAGSENMPGVIIPTKAVREIARLADKGEGKLDICVNATRIMVMRDGDELASKLIDGNFPDYHRVIPARAEHDAKLDADALKAAVERVATIASERGRAVKFAFGAKDGLDLSCRNPDQGDASDMVEIDYEGPALEIGFNAKYVADIIGAMGSDAVEINMGGPGAPSLWRASATAPTLYVLMPMRV